MCRARRGERACDQHVARREHGVGAERDRRQREPDGHRQQDEAVLPPQERPMAVRIGGDDEGKRAQNRQELRRAVRHPAQLLIDVRTRGQEHRGREQHPPRDPPEDEQPAAVCVEQQQDRGDHHRGGARHNTWVHEGGLRRDPGGVCRRRTAVNDRIGPAIISFAATGSASRVVSSTW